jgi:hypothetical protein
MFDRVLKYCVFKSLANSVGLRVCLGIVVSKYRSIVSKYVLERISILKK